MIGFDTISLGKIFDLLKTQWKTLLDELLGVLDIFITIEVRKELLHKYEDQLAFIESIKILPIRNISFQEYSTRGFDDADASLLEYSELDDIVIITEDNEMLLEGISEKNNIIQLIDLFLELFTKNLINSKEMYHLIKYFRKKRSITARKEKNALDEIRR